MADETVAKRPTETEMRHLLAKTPRPKGWEGNEEYLVNVFRKCSEDERILVIIFAERLAMARIKARLEHDRLRHRKAA